jgi:WD40 repeat protein
LLAVGSFNDRTVLMFAVAGDGELTPVAGSPFATGEYPLSVAFSPSGAQLATANEGDDDVSVFNVAQDGELSSVAGSPFPTGADPRSVAFSPSGGLLATANSVGDDVSLFSVDHDGALTPTLGSPLPTGRYPTSVAFDAGGRFLAVANAVTNTASVFSIGAGDEAAPVVGSPFPTGDGPTALAFNPRDTSLVVANEASDDVSVFAPTRPAMPAPGPPATPSPAPGPTHSSTSPNAGPDNHFKVSRIRTFASGTVSFSIDVPGPGRIDVLETAWKNNLARSAAQFQPAPGRLVYGRDHAAAGRKGVIKLVIRPNALGRKLVRHHRYRVTLRLWLAFTPTGGKTRTTGIRGLHLAR